MMYVLAWADAPILAYQQENTPLMDSGIFSLGGVGMVISVNLQFDGILTPTPPCKILQLFITVEYP